MSQYTKCIVTEEEAWLEAAVSQYKELYCDQRTVGWAYVMIQLIVS